MGSGQYLDRAAAALDGARRPPVRARPHWHRAPGLADLLASAGWSTSWTGWAATPRRRSFFTAHSVPSGLVAGATPMTAQVAESATAVAEAAGLDDARRPVGVAWQSAGPHRGRLGRARPAAT